MEKKYELLKDKKNTIKHNGRILHRIRALRDFNNIKAGELGGYIERERNLQHTGLCWVYDKAKVYDDAIVCGNAQIYGYAEVCDGAIVCEDAQVHGHAKVYGCAYVYGYADIYGYSKICGNDKIGKYE